MKTSKHIPTGKIKRAGKLIGTGLTVGKNYASHLGSKLLGGEVDDSKLNQKNATAIIESLMELRGGGLKIAQMLSMEKSLLPKEYADQFSLAQFSVPPLSIPLVKKTFRKYWGKNPDALFDTFNYEASFAASIGQVHEATLDNKKLAVKIQYPGVADSIDSDLAVIKPIAYKIMRMSGAEADKYFLEVKRTLIEETDYALELKNSQEITNACAKLDGYIFPSYYPKLSSNRVLTMDWIDGLHLPEFAQSDASQEERNRIGQKIWDLYMFQVGTLQKVHADPHPGNILITKEGKICVLDFGCTKSIPDEFIAPFFELMNPEILDNDVRFIDLLNKLEILHEDDDQEEREYYIKTFHDMLSLILRPFTLESWDFSDKTFFDEISEAGERVAKETLFSSYSMNRGSQHFIYINRTFFGLYQLMHLIGAEIDVRYGNV
jgi:predicted unusual protein kinase regulating ubiquinone biosynthesis (AarF/ABC1/UbiB family)